MLSAAGLLARAYSLAGLAIEEVGKAGNLGALAVMPENVRAQAPVGRMLEWHQMKLVDRMFRRWRTSVQAVTGHDRSAHQGG